MKAIFYLRLQSNNKARVFKKVTKIPNTLVPPTQQNPATDKIILPIVVIPGSSYDDFFLVDFQLVGFDLNSQHLLFHHEEILDEGSKSKFILDSMKKCRWELIDKEQ